jgi:hypothetical protein
MYYNSTFVRNPQLKEFQKTAQKQEDVVLEMFKTYNDQVTRWTKWDLHDAYPTFILPTSIGRALHTLEKENKIEKLEEKKTSKYGRPEFVYQLKK